MGYSTEFKGKLTFTHEVSVKQIAALNKILGEDCRSHPEWGAPKLTHMDLQLTKEMDGIEWNGSEKTYDLTEKVNLVIFLMQKQYPDFGLSGSLVAQGEAHDDRWRLVISKNVASQVDIEPTGRLVQCPECEHDFRIDEEE